MTEQARAALGNRPEVLITEFPFKVGRESRNGTLEKWRATLERRRGSVPPVNDLYLLEPMSNALHISREHFAIWHVDGRFVFMDRDSACGTIVSGTMLGGDGTARRVDLKDGDEIVVGSAASPYVFRFNTT